MTLVWANTALAEGAYQRTDDRKKAMVWNNDPQPGDIASWSGDRDEDGYATGEGRLSWFRSQKSLLTGSNIGWHKKVPISSYTGTMVHGKFSGSVETVDHGKTYHAKFADGQRKGRWAKGPAPATTEVAETKTAESTQERKEAASDEDEFRPGEKASEDVVVKTPSEPSAKETAQRSEEILNAARKARESAEPPPPAEGPGTEVSDQKPAVSKPQKAEAEKRIAKNTQTVSDAASTDQPEESAPPRTPVTKRGALAPGAVRAFDQPGRTARKSEVEPAKEKAKPTGTSPEQKEEKTAATKPKAPSVEPAKAAKTEPQETEVEPESPAEGPLKTGVSSQKSAVSQSKIEPPKPASQQTPVDDSIRTLTGPPSSLHVNPPAGAAPPQKTEEKSQQAETQPPPTTAVSPPAPAAPKLTAVEAMDAADIEARTNGYDLGDYQLPKADFNTANGTWSVTYVRRDADKSGKQLNVTVQDKNGKAEVKK